MLANGVCRVGGVHERGFTSTSSSGFPSLKDLLDGRQVLSGVSPQDPGSRGLNVTGIFHQLSCHSRMLIDLKEATPWSTSLLGCWRISNTAK